jgi:hypothetical protein
MTKKLLPVHFFDNESFAPSFCVYGISIMTDLFNYIRKPIAQAVWGAETIFALAVARFLIKFVPFRHWRCTLGVLDHAPDSNIETDELKSARAHSVGRWVQRTAKKVPFEAVCLSQAMTCRWMLLRRGLASQVFLGTKRDDETNAVVFHAWVMHGDLCLTGHHEKDSYMVFSKQQSRKSRS